MTKHMSVAEAQSHFAAVLDAVERGDEVILTRDGEAVAKLVPCEARASEERSEPSEEVIARRREALRKIQEIARRLKINPSQEEIKSWINEGRE
ncbi:MAG: type II toxin-antitoxin system prevent-host-death family antitoxin [Variibacter sp.]|nr:type II toxin-antitoxin system prevent-host-death family antitoxin [Variibacter sp.]